MFYRVYRLYASTIDIAAEPRRIKRYSVDWTCKVYVNVVK